MFDKGNKIKVIFQDTIIYSIEGASPGAETFFVLRQKTGLIVVNADLRNSRPSGDEYTVSFLLLNNKSEGKLSRTVMYDCSSSLYMRDTIINVFYF
jgi:hypothetical protein